MPITNLTGLINDLPYIEGLIFGMASLYLEWRAYTRRGLILRWAYIQRFTVLIYNHQFAAAP